MSEGRLKEIKAELRNLKRKITNFHTFVEAYVDTRDSLTLEKRKSDIDSDFAKFETLCSELDLLEEDPIHDTSRTEYEEKYYHAYGKAMLLLQNRRSQSHNSTDSNSSGSTQHIANEMLNVTSQLSKKTLPRINLPTFSGSYESWLGFYDLFRSLVDNNNDIPEIEKLYHLKGCLKDEAAEVLESIELSADNYKVAWNLLKDRYDNRKIIRQTHVRALLELRNISKEFPVRSFLDTIQKHIRALEALKEPVHQWDTLLIEIINQKLNSFLREKWEDLSCETANPTLKELLSFLQRRAHFEDGQSGQNATKSPGNNKFDRKQSSRPNNNTQHALSTMSTQNSCSYCQKDHFIYRCDEFKNLSPMARFEAAKKCSLCINCLRTKHRVSECKSPPCRKCQKMHHTFLHFDKQNNEELNTSQKSPQSLINANIHTTTSSECLLATALVDLVNNQGKTKTCRLLLDSGSQANFVTDNVATFLNLPRRAVEMTITCVDNTSIEINHAVSALLKSKFSKYSKKLDFFILDEITKPTPSASIDRAHFEIPKNIALADPNFYKTSGIDILLGMQVFFKLMCVGQISLKNQPDVVLQKTQLGWIVAGELKASSSPSSIRCHMIRNSNSLDTALTKFWEVEEMLNPKPLSKEEQACEDHFKTHTTRNSDGRYVIRLPFNEKKNLLGDSRSIALRRFNFLEKRFEKDSDLKSKYCDFLIEYKDLNHLSELEIRDRNMPGFYLPHHPVLKEDSVTTKLRVIFDGSAKTSTGVSLNDCLMVGPTIQNDLFSLLTRFRTHTYVLTADIEKMYRQVSVHPDDALYQRILFRESDTDKVQDFILNTVTYGTSSAPFLAIRALHQLAIDESSQHPISSIIVKEDFYVDDMLTGTNTYEEAKFLQSDISTLLNKGGFQLRKWASNDPSLVPKNSSHLPNDHLSLDPNSSTKTLGINWYSQKDIIFYKVNVSEFSHVVSKRSILSQVAKLFDPLGLLGPVIVKAKILIQLLWKAGVDWDASIPLEIHTMWSTIKEELHLLNNASFDRLIIAPNSVVVQIHGFCDASEKAYGACVYMRSTDSHGKTNVSLICSKSRVAPVVPLTLPRLELCAALLLSRLISSLLKSFKKIKIDNFYLWSDSTITLNWVKTEPHLLKTFVSNRVAEIQALTKFYEWRHVSTHDNPADAISRGQTPHEFLEPSIWKTGPAWLSQSESNWPRFDLQNQEILEKRVTVSTVHITKNVFDTKFIERFSSLKKLKLVVSYVMRFINNIRNKSIKLTGPISTEELNSANQKLIITIQLSSFSKDISALKKEKNLPDNSRLIPLAPFLDKQGILRVGGRLINAKLSNDQKHQMLIPSNHHLTKLIIREEHERLKHAGTQATLYSVREHYWPLNGRNITRQIIHQCVKCFRAKPKHVDYLMGDLPQERVSYSRPFYEIGVDYCGPFFIKEKRFRNRNKIKVYVSVFVCMSTKAVHLEIVSDLTTEAFIACLKRLFSRRGICKSIFSDNATNFVGANREINEMYQLVQSSEHINALQKFCTDQKINWNFIPPRSPHFGGLWEAAVKAFKHHLVRTVGDTLLTYEQLETYVIEIESILNSRPISPMSPDPNDLQPLTPGHFLIGGPLTSLPEIDFTNTPSNRLSAWQHAQKLRHHFWKRWKREYLHQLTVRSKWNRNTAENLNIGSLVVINDDNLPPMQWKLGRITALHPGADNIVRVVSVKTDSGVYKRCTKRLCPLPLDS